MKQIVNWGKNNIIDNCKQTPEFRELFLQVTVW